MPSPTQDAIAAFWSDVLNGATLKKFIDEDKAAGNCSSLQDTFDAQSNAQVLTYIDQAMKDAGCY